MINTDDKKKLIHNLLLKVKNYDQQALMDLMQLVECDLQRLAIKYLGDLGLAEEVVNETFSQLVDKCGKLKDNSNLEGWLKTIVINKSINIIRKRKYEVLSPDFILDIYSKNSECSEDEIIEQIHIKDCLSKLDENERLALIYHLNGFTISEIRFELNSTYKKTRNILTKAKTKFKNLYENK